MPALRWNLCTTFGAIGAAIAYAILFFWFGAHWQLVPAAVAGLAVVYGVSTALGTLALKYQLGRFPIAGAIVCVGIAWCTLFSGALAISISLFVVAVVDGLTNAPSGQPALNVLAEIAPGAVDDLITTPLAVGMVYGLAPAAVLGIIYGVLLGSGFDTSQVHSGSTKKWVRGAAAAVLLLSASLVAALTATSIEVSAYASHYAKTPVAIRGCTESAVNSGVLASCLGSPCERGECDWEVRQDAFVLHVLPPVGSAWRWVGGGIGTTQRPNIIRHNIYWAQFESDGSLNDGSPRRYASYELVFDGDTVSVGESIFQFEPGMRLNIRFLDNWSVVASEANGAGR